MKHSLQNTVVLTAVLLAFSAPAAAMDPTTMTLHADQPGPVVDRNIYGHFAEHLGRCIYEGFWVGEDSPIPNTRGIRNDVVEALKALNIPVLRWPGGCFADEYHWEDGIGPRNERPKRINTHWGGVIETNAFGTHEFFDLCEMLGAEPYVSGNLGSGTPQEMMAWIEYMTSDADSTWANLRRANGREEPWSLRYFAVGNESWGCGGNMSPEYYSELYRHFNTYVKNFSGNRIFRIACGANSGDYNWTRVVMENVGRRRMNGLSLHYYTIPTGNWGRKGSATDFDEAQYHETLRRTLQMDELLTQHIEIMDELDPRNRIGLMVDEWGVWTDPEPGSTSGFLYQQNSLRDALLAALNFHIFHRHAERVKMANIAQTVNVLQAMILTDGDMMLLTPTYHVFEMFKVHQDGTFLPIEIETPDYTLDGESIPAVSASATRSEDGTIYFSWVNTNPNEEAQVTCQLVGVEASTVEGRVLTAVQVNSHNTFDAPDTVTPTVFDGAVLEGSELRLTLPSKSVGVLAIK